MPKAIFHKIFNHSNRSKGISWRVNPSNEPQSYPREVIDAAVRAGSATRPEAKPKEE